MENAVFTKHEPPPPPPTIPGEVPPPPPPNQLATKVAARHSPQQRVTCMMTLSKKRRCSLGTTRPSKPRSSAIIELANRNSTESGTVGVSRALAVWLKRFGSIDLKLERETIGVREAAAFLYFLFPSEIT